MNRLLVFGLDGCSLPILSAYAQAHPTGLFSRFLSSGYIRTLHSTLPYFTAPAWTTFATGLAPGNHGMYHWRGRYRPDESQRPLLSSAHLADATIWAYCQQQGGRVGITNFPMQYPAPPTDGYYLCGTLAPESAPNVSWPSGLIHKVRAVIPDYRFEMDKGLSYLDRPTELREHILEVGLGHNRVFEVLQGVRVDLQVHIVTITDRMQHFFWPCFDTLHPSYNPATRDNPIFDAYRLAESQCEALWAEGDWDNIIILSDHGMGRSTISFHADAWLASLGLTTIKPSGQVDIVQSQAYSGEEPECAIYINRHSRDGCGVADDKYPELAQEIRAALLKLMLPGTNQPAFLEVYLGVNIYMGNAAHLGPDLILVPADGVHPRPGNHDKIFDRATRLYAGHRKDGIFMGYGKDFSHSDYRGAPAMAIGDLFPLMCALLAMPIPGGLTGHMPNDLTDHFGAASKIVETIDWRQQIDGLPLPQHHDTKGVLTRLSELGYI